MEDYDLSDTLYSYVLKRNKLEEKDLTQDEIDFLYEQCEEMDSEIFDFVREQKENLEEYRKDREHDEQEEKRLSEKQKSTEAKE